jgi:hypothetical protein
VKRVFRAIGPRRKPPMLKRWQGGRRLGRRRLSGHALVSSAGTCFKHDFAGFSRQHTAGLAGSLVSSSPSPAAGSSARSPRLAVRARAGACLGSSWGPGPAPGCRTPARGCCCRCRRSRAGYTTHQEQICWVHTCCRGEPVLSGKEACQEEGMAPAASQVCGTRAGALPVPVLML